MDYEPIDSARPYGLVITDIDPAALARDDVRRELRELWVFHGLIVFRGGASADLQLALSQVFGELEIHTLREMHSADNPALIDIRYDPEKEDIWQVGDRALGAWLPWHSDLVYVDRINHGGVLRALTLPSSGGETGFIDQIEAYEALVETIKVRIEGLRVIYMLDNDYRRHRYGRPVAGELLQSSARREGIAARLSEYSPVTHPLVYQQPETGRRVLNLSPMCAIAIEGMDDEEGHALLGELIDHVTDDRFAYYHRWALDEMVLWDNWRMLHRATGVSPQDVREMQRTTIAGDYALGRRLEAAQP